MAGKWWVFGCTHFTTVFVRFVLMVVDNLKGLEEGDEGEFAGEGKEEEEEGSGL